MREKKKSLHTVHLKLEVTDCAEDNKINLLYTICKTQRKMFKQMHSRQEKTSGGTYLYYEELLQ